MVYDVNIFELINMIIVYKLMSKSPLEECFYFIY